MAEGLINHDFAGRIEACSDGTASHAHDPRAVQVMAVRFHYRPEHIDSYADRQFDYVITLCRAANESCPLFVGGIRRIHIGFDDPPQATGGEQQVLAVYRRVCDEIRQQLGELFRRKLGG